MLDISHLATRDPRAIIRAQWARTGDDEWARRFSIAHGLVSTVMSAHIPQRLAVQLLRECGVAADRRATELRRGERAALYGRRHGVCIALDRRRGFAKAEVTGGGGALDDVHPGTLESRRHAGLLICGEMLDAFGPIGGHNFAWAWATGRLAGTAAAMPFP